MNSRAVGLSVRFFRVTMPTGTGAIGNSTGKTLSYRALGYEPQHGCRENRQKAPVARRLTRTSLGSVTTVARG
jgi:hypothetical protein